MANLYLRTMRWSYERIKNRDIFSQSVSLTYKGKETRNSCIGGAATVFIIILVLSYSIFLFDRMIFKKEISWNQNTKRQDWTDPENSMVWNELFPDPVFMWHFIPENGEFKYFEHAQVRTMQRIEHSNGTFEEILIPEKECEAHFLEKTFPDHKFLVAGPDLKGFDIRNSEDETLTKMIAIQFSFGTTIYGNGTELLGIQNHPEMSILSEIENKEVDLDNIDEPIRQTPDIKHRLQIKKGIFTAASLTIQKNEVYLEDSWLPIFGDVKPKIFYSVGETEMDYFNFPDQQMPGAVSITLKANNHVQQYKRKCSLYSRSQEG